MREDMFEYSMNEVKECLAKIDLSETNIKFVKLLDTCETVPLEPFDRAKIELRKHANINRMDRLFYFLKDIIALGNSSGTDLVKKEIHRFKKNPNERFLQIFRFRNFYGICCYMDIQKILKSIEE